MSNAKKNLISSTANTTNVKCGICGIFKPTFDGKQTGRTWTCDDCRDALEEARRTHAPKAMTVEKFPTKYKELEIGRDSDPDSSTEWYLLDEWGGGYDCDHKPIEEDIEGYRKELEETGIYLTPIKD